MATSLAWTGDDDTLAQNTDVYGQVFGGQTQGLKGQMKSESKAKVASDKAAATAAKEQQGIEQKSATTNMIRSIAETGGQLAMAGAFKGGGPGSKSKALSQKSAELGTKGAELGTKADILKGQQTSALARGETAQAARFGRQAERATTRSGNLATRSADLGARSADLHSKAARQWYKKEYGTSLPKTPAPGDLTGQELAAHNEMMNIINGGQ